MAWCCRLVWFGSGAGVEDDGGGVFGGLAGQVGRSRDEFNFSVNLQFGEPTLAEIRAALVELTHQQHARNQAAA